MPVYEMSVSLVDDYNRKARMSFETQSLADETTALAAAAALITDLQALTQLGVIKYSIGQRVVVNETPAASSNKDAGLTMSVRKTDGDDAPLRVKAPVTTIFDSNGNLDIGDALVTAYVDNFLAAGDFTFSDGENAVSIVSGYLDT